MHLSPAILAAALLLAIPAAPAQSIPLAEFSQGGLEQWEEQRFNDRTHYRLVRIDDGRTVLHAHSRAAGSGLYRSLDLDIRDTPCLTWSWKVRNTLGDIDESTRGGDDFAARIYVVFNRSIAFWRTRAISFVWASRKPEGEVWRNPFSDSLRMVALRSGEAQTGRWVQERVDLRRRYREQYGEAPERIEGIAVMTDTDNTGKTTEAWYGDIRLEPAEACNASG